MINSESNERVTNNSVRHQYRVLTEIEKQQMVDIKDRGLEFIEYINSLSTTGTREYSLAKTKIEEAVMWAVKGLTQ